MPVRSGRRRIDPQALEMVERYEREYEEARVFRTLLIPRLVALATLVFGAVSVLHLSWKPIGVVGTVVIGSIVTAVRIEWRHGAAGSRPWTR